MKKLLYISIISATFFSCSEFVEDYNDSPNSPTNVTAPLLLSNAEVSIFATYHGQLARTSNLISQTLEGTDFQMVNVSKYDIQEGDNQNEWDVIYSDVVQTCNTLSEKFGARNPYYNGMSKTLKAMALSVATDLWGDVPAKEAGKGIEGLTSPAYDAQEDIYAMIQSLLSEAMAHFNEPSEANASLPGGDDLIHAGNVEAWKKMVAMLKARYAIHLSAVNENQSATDALNFLSMAGVLERTDNSASAFGSAGNELNPWAAFETDRGGYIKMGATLVDLMQSGSDPRLTFYSAGDTTSDSTVYRGAILGSSDQTASSIGTYLQGTSLNLIGYVEAKFIEAEAKFRTNDLVGASEAYNEAIAASVESVTAVENIDFQNAVSADETTITLEKIMTQKYIALFGHIEIMNDMRRTGFPALTPNPNGIIGSIPVRLPTPLEERLYNTNAKVVSDITQPVWWDQ